PARLQTLEVIRLRLPDQHPIRGIARLDPCDRQDFVDGSFLIDGTSIIIIVTDHESRETRVQKGVEPRRYFPCVGRSDRRAQGDRSTLQSIRTEARDAAGFGRDGCDVRRRGDRARRSSGAARSARGPFPRAARKWFVGPPNETSRRSTAEEKCPGRVAI